MTLICEAEINCHNCHSEPAAAAAVATITMQTRERITSRGTNSEVYADILNAIKQTA
jgi:hypothetical protein